jgi:ariadne-1
LTFVDGAADAAPDEFCEPDAAPEIVLGSGAVKVVAVLRPEDVRAQADAKTRHVATLFGMSMDLAQLLLEDRAWSIDRLSDDWMRPGAAQKLTASYGISYEARSIPPRLQPGKSRKKVECLVCFESFPGKELLALPCGHGFCRSCWANGIAVTIRGGGTRMRCLHAKCRCHLAQEDMAALAAADLLQRFEAALIETIIVANSQLVHCPVAGCRLILTPEAVGLCRVATCTCGGRLCWKCRDPAHAPLPCDQVTRWRELTKEDVLVGEWLKCNTKPCPRCGKLIEKNGGCNQMLCGGHAHGAVHGGCGLEFCWICERPWKEHTGPNPYGCTKPPERSADADPDSLIRLSHYHDRYVEHLRSAKNEANQLETNRSTLLASFTGSANAIFKPDAEKLIERIFKAIVCARSVTMWSFPMAFFMRDAKQLQIFEHRLAGVAAQIEIVSALVERTPWRPVDVFQVETARLEEFTEVLNRFADTYSK